MNFFELLDTPRQWQHAFINLPLGAAGYSLCLSADAGPKMLAGGLLMIFATARAIGIEYRQAADKAPINPAIEFQEARALAEGKLRAAQMEPQKPVVNDWAKPAIHGGLVLQNLTVRPVVDHEREFCKTLVNMKQVDGEMDISETYWLKGGHWQKMDLQNTPTSFYTMRNKFEYHGIVGKKGTASNSPYVVLNIGAVERIATGQMRHLTTPPGMA